jgi:hypothetical protein
MALIRCSECAREVSDKAATCPNCGAPVDHSLAIPVPENIGFEEGQFVGTSTMIIELAKKALNRLNYRVDATDAAGGTVTFTTGVTMGSWSGVSGTISWLETKPYRFKVSGSGKQNVKGGQMVALNLFDEANGKANNVVAEMERLARGGSENETPAGGCVVLLFALGGGAVACAHFALGMV